MNGLPHVEGATVLETRGALPWWGGRNSIASRELGDVVQVFACPVSDPSKAVPDSLGGIRGRVKSFADRPPQPLLFSLPFPPRGAWINSQAFLQEF